MDENEIAWLMETSFRASLRILGGRDTLRNRVRFYMSAMLIAQRFPCDDSDVQLKALQYLETKCREIHLEVVTARRERN